MNATLCNGSFGGAIWAKSVRIFTELRFADWLNDLQYTLLHDTV